MSQREEIVIEIDGGGSFDDGDGHLQKTGLTETVTTRVKGAFGQATALLVALSNELAQSRAQLVANAPDKTELTFGIKFSAEGSVYIAKTSADAQLSVKYIWEK